MTVSPAATTDANFFAPGMYVDVRDEEWLITKVDPTTDGWRLEVRGVSEYVRDVRAVFFSALDAINVFDPSDVSVVPDTHSPNYRRTRLFVESMLRGTPIPLYREELSVATQMLADPLEYQLTAVRQALSADNIRPRILIADAVGLGKTLEMGMILAELIRRGRGERILVVTPKHVMEQMQQEMWTRFAIPLVRLDSQGIQRVRQLLPGSKNPFSYFPRVIVSLDTLKQAKYKAQLEKVRWDAVVIDEIHNATNIGTQNNELARLLAPTTEALIVASATPHNGDAESFKEILRLLDPTSVLPDGEVDKDALERLVIRRHRHSPDVAKVVGAKWAERKPPNNIPVDTYDEERAVADELADVWINPDKKSPADAPLQAWTLVKAYLSSPAALAESITNRLPNASTQERQALERLAELNDKVSAEESGKFLSLVNYLDSIGVGKRSPTRVVIFSERVATLHWLQQNLKQHFGFTDGAVRIMHGGLPDHEQMALIDEFKRDDTPIRVLVTGDVASEGVNLHAKCHHLVHYDIPWSLIRIQQRNGRIDRYGQTKPPEITTLLLDPDNGSLASEVHVLARLMEREYEAQQVLGDVSSLMGQNTVAREEDVIRDVLRGERDFDDSIKDPNEIADNATAEFDPTDLNSLLRFATSLKAEAPTTEVPAEQRHSTLFDSEEDYLVNALNEAFFGNAADPKNGVNLQNPNRGVLTLEPPKDLQRSFRYLPKEYLDERGVSDKVMLATTTEMGNISLNNARTGDSVTTWPQAHFLGPLHPVTTWASDRALASMGRREVPAITGDVDAPSVLLMGTVTNRRGQVISRGFVITTHHGALALPEIIGDPVAWLRSVGLTGTSVNDGSTDLHQVPSDLIPTAIEAGRNALAPMLGAAVEEASIRVQHWRERAEHWQANRATVRGTAKLKRAGELIDSEAELVAMLTPEDNALVRPLLVVVPREANEKEG